MHGYYAQLPLIFTCAIPPPLLFCLSRNNAREDVMRIKQELLSCIDCVAFVANGEIPESRPHLVNEIRARLGADARRLAVTCGDQIDFSWAPCQCCGSPLGGSREAMVVYAR